MSDELTQKEEKKKKKKKGITSARVLGLLVVEAA